MPTILLLVGAALCTFLYIWAYFTAEAPHSDSLEWISLYEKPEMVRQGHTHPMKWLDIVWCILLFGLAAALYLTPLAWLNGTFDTTVPLGWFLFFLALPLGIPAVLAFRLGKAFSDKFWIGLITALFLTFHAISNGQGSDTVPMLLCLLLTLAYFSGKGFWAWFSLVLSGLTLALAVWSTPVLLFLALPWLGTILFAEILRMKREDSGPLHLILALLTAIFTVGIGTIFLYFPIPTDNLPATLADPKSYTVFWQSFLLAIPSRFFDFEEISVTALPAMALLLSGTVMGIGAVVKRHPLGVVLLMWAGAAFGLGILFPAAAPMYIAAMVLAYLVSRLQARKCGAAAWIVGLVPVIITLITSILTLWRNFI